MSLQCFGRLALGGGKERLSVAPVSRFGLILALGEPGRSGGLDPQPSGEDAIMIVRAVRFVLATRKAHWVEDSILLSHRSFIRARTGGIVAGLDDILSRLPIRFEDRIFRCLERTILRPARR